MLLVTLSNRDRAEALAANLNNIIRKHIPSLEYVQVSPKKKPIKTTFDAARRRPWKRKEVRDLRQWSLEKRKVDFIAKELNRTPGAVRQKAFSLGLSLDSRKSGLEVFL